MSAPTDRRFSATARLYGEEAFAKLQAAHIAVIGVGGVGSWAAEALARSGVGQLTLIDLDMVSESNTNRQVHALGDEYGKAKVDVMAARMVAINPNCRVHVVEDFITPDNAAVFLSPPFSAVLDAVDDVRAKIAIACYAYKKKIPFVLVGAAGGQSDPTKIRVADLSESIEDPLLAKVRSRLRRDHGFLRGGKKMDVPVVFSSEAIAYPEASCDTTPIESGLHCGGLGSSVCVTAAFGMAASAYLLQKIAGNK